MILWLSNITEHFYKLDGLNMTMSIIIFKPKRLPFVLLLLPTGCWLLGIALCVGEDQAVGRSIWQEKNQEDSTKHSTKSTIKKENK